MNAAIKARFSEAVRRKNEGDLIAAKTILTDLSNVDPESPATWIVLGDVLWDLKDLEGAIRAFKQAVALRPTLESASLGLFRDSGDQEGALEEVKRFFLVTGSNPYNEIVKEINSLP